jgi:hypothetical protein
MKTLKQHFCSRREQRLRLKIVKAVLASQLPGGYSTGELFSFCEDLFSFIRTGEMSLKKY